jgi:hypothetical protein
MRNKCLLVRQFFFAPMTFVRSLIVSVLFCLMCDQKTIASKQIATYCTFYISFMLRFIAGIIVLIDSNIFLIRFIVVIIVLFDSIIFLIRFIVVIIVLLDSIIFLLVSF